MKIIFKPKNKITEKLVFDERLILSEVHQVQAKATDAELKKVEDAIIQLGEKLKDAENSLSDMTTSISVLETAAKAKIPDALANDSNAAISEAEFITNVNKFIKDQNSILLKKNGGDTDLLKTAKELIAIIKGQCAELQAEKNSTQEKALQDKINANLEAYKNLVIKINGSTNFKAKAQKSLDKIKDLYRKLVQMTVDYRSKKFSLYTNNLLTLITKIKNLCEPINKLTQSCEEINKLNFNDKGIESKIKAFNDLADGVEKNINELITLINDLTDLHAAGNYNFSAKAGTTWKDRFIKALKDDAKDSTGTMSGKSSYVDLFKEYIAEQWPGVDEKTILELRAPILDAGIKLGFETDKNILFIFLKNLFKNKKIEEAIYNDPDKYNVVHNAIIKGKITEEDLKNQNSIVNSEALYTKEVSVINDYIDKYVQAKQLIDKHKFINTALETKYGGNTDTFLADLFYFPGDVLAPSLAAAKVNYDTTALHTLQDIDTILKKCFGEEAVKATEPNKEKEDEAIDTEFYEKLIKALNLDNSTTDELKEKLNLLLFEIDSKINTNKKRDIRNKFNLKYIDGSAARTSWRKYFIGTVDETDLQSHNKETENAIDLIVKKLEASSTQQQTATQQQTTQQPKQNTTQKKATQQPKSSVAKKKP